MDRTTVELLVRKLTPFHLFLCRDCEYRGWRLGALPGSTEPAPDQSALGLPVRPIEYRDHAHRRWRLRHAAISFLVAALLGAWLGGYVHGCQQPPADQGE